MGESRATVMNNTTDMKHALVKKARSICPCLQGGVDGSDAKHSEDALIPQKIKSAHLVGALLSTRRSSPCT